MEQRNEERPSGSRLSTWATVILAGLALYLVPLIAVVIDEEVLGTRWFVRHFPRGSREVFRTVYPFLRWFVPY